MSRDLLDFNASTTSRAARTNFTDSLSLSLSLSLFPTVPIVHRSKLRTVSAQKVESTFSQVD